MRYFKALEVRLADLSKGFEEATIDKNDQEEKTNKMDKKLETAARLKKVKAFSGLFNVSRQNSGSAHGLLSLYILKIFNKGKL